MRNDGGWDQNDEDGRGKKWSDSKQNLKVESIEFVGGLDLHG